MDHGGQRRHDAPSTRTTAAPRRSEWVERFPLRAVALRLYQWCERLTEPLIYFALIFSPWAFGTPFPTLRSTETWAIGTMNVTGYLLGAMLLVKLAIRRFGLYQPPRWGTTLPNDNRKQADFSALVIQRLAWLTVAILVYCLVSALNARATYHRHGQSFEYHQCLAWLPHSLDRTTTWLAFWNYLALAGSFWAIRDWLPGKTRAEELAARRTIEPAPARSGHVLPARLRRLLWVLAINGGLLAAESIVQRHEGSGKLLFLIKPSVNPDAVTQFGPFAYRANASQYFNLLWPVCVAFWWMLQQSGGRRRATNHWLLLCAVLMAAGPIISTSRGGAMIMIGIVVLATFFLVTTHFLLVAGRQVNQRSRVISLVVVMIFFVAAIQLGYSLGWKALKPRMAQISEGFAGREDMFEVARPMAKDYPDFGTGPGTFEAVFQLYRPTTDTYWPAQLHNDWLETRITFGWVGLAFVVAALALVPLRWFVPGGIHGGRRFVMLTWLALAGCLVHARFDFPFQIYSIVFLFLTLCAMLVNLTRHPN